MTAEHAVTPRVGLAEVRAARDVLSGVVETTPVVISRALSQLCAGPVWFKCENLQRTGSFKIRGAYTRLHRLDPEQRARGVVTASAGNHAQGVALAAQMLGISATVFMPRTAALPKVAATRSYGAEVRLVGDTVEACLLAAAEMTERTGAVLIHPFDHPDVIAGQGTVGVEIVEQVPDVRTVLVPVGGGGLIGGVAAAVKGLTRNVSVVGVQVEGAAAWPASLAAGAPVTLDRVHTIADGLAVARPGDVTFPQIASLVDTFVTVDDDAVSRALLHCLERAKLLVEPAGAAPVAALLEQPDRFAPPVVAVLSGGNIDPLVLVHLVQHGLTAAGRYLSLQVRMQDRPGALARLLTLIGAQGANVLDVSHSRVSRALPLGDVDVAITLETRGPDHSREVVAAVRAAGHIVNVTSGG